jgi:segregation and condensation protein B
VNRRLPLALRLPADEPAGDAPASELSRTPELARVEAALFLADEPLAARKLAAVAALTDAAAAGRLVEQLRGLYDAEGSSFQVEELAGGYQLLTRAGFHPWLARLRAQAPEGQLSPAARETLAIVAYRQPLTRADVEAIRGVGSSDVLEKLMEKGLVRLAGRDDSLGRPALYETTRKFLQVFGLKSLKALPPCEGVSDS